MRSASTVRSRAPRSRALRESRGRRCHSCCARCSRTAWCARRSMTRAARTTAPSTTRPIRMRPSSSALPGQLERALGAPVTLENDVNLAAVAEQRRGLARDVADFAFLLVGAGLGAAVMLDRKLHRGHNGNAGELDAVRNGRTDDVD